MHRKGVFVDVLYNDTRFNLVNLHLDSMINDSSTRRLQLRVIDNLFRGKNNVVLCGDFNFGDAETDDYNLQREFVDPGKQDKQVTYDIENNRLAAKTKFDNEKSRRLDRFYLKANVKILEYKVIKNQSSDHYPIFLKFEFK